MDKKDLKFYEAPIVETVDFELEGQILTSSPTGGELEEGEIKFND